jgi:hypothetical protein
MLRIRGREMGTVIAKHMWAAPKPGHEFEYALAWKHRYIASGWMLRLSRKPFACRAYRRAYELWGDALDRIKEHGDHVLETFPATSDPSGKD